METGPKPPDYSGDTLSLRDIGVEPEQTKTPIQPEELEPSNVVDMHTRPSSSERKKPTAKALFLAGAALLGTAKLAQEAFSEKIHPAHRIVDTSELNNATDVEIEDVKPGSTLEVSPFSYTITGGNVRTSPGVESVGGEPDANMVQHADLSGKVITHPIEVPDSSNPKNGNWYVFFDSDGQKFAVNEQNLDVMQDPNQTSTDDIKVTVDKTTNMGIIAHDNNNISMQVATVVDTKS